MLKRHNKFWENIMLIGDMLIIAVAWIAAYQIRSSGMGVPLVYDIHPFKTYLVLILPIMIVWPFIFKNMGLYRPRRISSHISEFFDVAKASTLALIVVIATAFFARKYELSRLVFLYFWIISVVSLSVSRLIFRESLRLLRSKGYNQRYAIVVGAGELGERVARKIKANPWTGIDVLGFLDDEKSVGAEIAGGEVIGRISEIDEILDKSDVDQVFIALPVRSYKRLMYVVGRLQDKTVSVRIIPDIYQALTLNASVEEFDGLHLINLTDSPMYGWNVIVKRFMDVVCSSAAIIVTAPIMLMIAVATKLTSTGPVFYKQERMGLDGKTFKMLKFRSMRVDAEVQTGAVWASENDPRRTRLGTFLRMTSLDELPQFFNVLKGEMSIVGPRPERPVFIEEFKKNVPGYMLRHKMKAGITGWAQVNGWRGNTCLEKRIECDLYYIENWSFWFDLKIMWLTLWTGFVHKNAY